MAEIIWIVKTPSGKFSYSWIDTDPDLLKIRYRQGGGASDKWYLENTDRMIENVGPPWDWIQAQGYSVVEVEVREFNRKAHEG